MTRNMKDSGIEWIGEIPEDWEISKFKRYSKSAMGNTILKTDLLENNEEGSLPVYSATQEDIIFGFIKKDGLSAILNKNNLVIPARGNSIGCTKLVPYDIATCTQTTIFSKLKNINPKFAYYCSIGFKEFWFEFDQTAIPQITVQQVENNYIPICSTNEQNRISNLLDRKTKQLEDIKATILKEIKTLEEYKKSVITEAVTKGLDKNAEMKDSGIEWIGEIPKHWKIIKIKNTALLKARIGWQGLKSEEFLYDESLPYLVTGTDFKDGIVDWQNCVRISEKRFQMDKNIQIKENDLLITKDGTIGKLAIARNCHTKASLNSGVFVVRNQGKYKYNDKYLYYVLLSEQFLLWFELNDAGNSTIRHLYQRDFYNFSFTYPCLEEQVQIVAYLDKKTAIIDEAITSKQKQLGILEEYKKSLIYEYVTGKKEVGDVGTI